MTTASPDRERGRSLRRAARGSAVNLAGSAIAAVATFALTVVVTRLTSPTQAGVFFSATSLFILVANLGRLGTNTGLVYFLSRSRAQGQVGLARTYMKVASRPVLLLAVLLGVGMFLGADALGALLSPGQATEFADYMRVMAVFLPVAAVGYLGVSGSQGLGTMKVYAVADQAVRPLLQLVLVALVLVTVGADVLPIAWTGAFLPFAITAWVWWRRLLARQDQPQAPPVRPGRTFWRFTWPRALASASQVAMQRLDIVLVGALAGLPEAAVYAAATRFLVLGQMAGRALSLSAQPLLGEALGRQDMADAKSLYQVCTAWLVLGVWPFYLLLIVFAEPALRVFGEGYEAGAPALVLLCGTMLFATACGMVNMVLNMAGKSLWNLLNVTIAFVVNVSIDLWLIPQMGLMGAAVGWAAAIAVANLLPLLQIRRTPGLHPFGLASLTSMVAAAGCFVGLPLLAGLAGDGSVLAIGGAVGVGGLIYVFFLIRARTLLQLDLLARSFRRRR